jgi:hypothetical protein
MHWTFTTDPIVHHHPRPGHNDMGPIGDAQAMMIDTRRKRYVAMLRGSGDDQGWRVMCESTDFVEWTPLRRLLYPLHDEEGLYNNTGFVYGAQYLGILTHFDRRAETQTQSLQLLTSRDGDIWSRAPAALPLVGLGDVGDVGDWDRAQIMLTGAPPVPVGDELHIYYRGTSRRHNKIVGEFEPRIDADQDRSSQSIGLAKLRLDGFASIDANYSGGSITTTLYRLTAGELHVNAKSDYGSVSAELLDAAYQPLAGFSIEACVAVAADSTSAPIRWRGADGDHPLARVKQPVRIRFHLRNARLYAYWAN